MVLALVPLAKPQDTRPLDLSLKAQPYLRKLRRETYDGLTEPNLQRIAEVRRRLIPFLLPLCQYLPCCPCLY